MTGLTALVYSYVSHIAAIGTNESPAERKFRADDKRAGSRPQDAWLCPELTIFVLC